MQTIDQQLIKACKKGNALTVKKLLHRGANPNTQDVDGKNPITIAAEYGHIKIIPTLIQYGTNPHTTDHIGRTALHYAVAKQYDDIAQYLITQLQLDPNTQDRWGQTPFLLATKNNDIDMLQLLAQHGADPNITDYKGQTALHHALEKQYDDIAQYLITQTHINPNTQDRLGYTPFLIALLNGDIDILQLLVQHGANPHTTGPLGRNALHHTIESPSYEYKHKTAQYLITQLQLDPNTPDRLGRTPFMIATQKGDIPMLQLLIQHGANPTTTDLQGRTALHYAVETQNPTITQYLLTQLQLDPNTQDRRGVTPFMIAAGKGDIDILKRLIQLGANPHATDRDGKTALHYAAEYDKPGTASFLINHLHLDPNSQDHQGITPLHIALQNGHHETAKTLTRFGAHPHIPNHQGEPATTNARQRRIRLPKPQPSPITL